MKILLDECLDRRLAKELKGHSVMTVPQMKWGGLKNGELLLRAEKLFDAFITVDQNLSFQQHLPKFQIKVLVLYAETNQLSDLKPLAPKILAALRQSQIRSLTRIS